MSDATELPEARIIEKIAFTDRAARFVKRWPWKVIGIAAAVLAALSGAGGGISYCVWKNFYWLPETSAFAGNWRASEESVASILGTGDAVADGECAALHGVRGELVAASDDLGLVAVRYSGSADLGAAFRVRIFVNADGHPDWKRAVLKPSDAAVLPECPPGTVILLSEDAWRKMPERYELASTAVLNAFAAESRRKDLLQRASASP